MWKTATRLCGAAMLLLIVSTTARAAGTDMTVTAPPDQWSPWYELEPGGYTLLCDPDGLGVLEVQLQRGPEVQQVRQVGRIWFSDAAGAHRIRIKGVGSAIRVRIHYQ